MYAGQKSVRGGIEDFLCPFTDMYMTCGPNEGKYHKGTMAVDVRGLEAGVRYDVFAPATSVCVWALKSNGQAMWQTVEPVRASDGYVGYITYVTCHDDVDFNAYAGLIVPQGGKIANMGRAGNTTGVHTHFEAAKGKLGYYDWHQNRYGNWCFEPETDPEDLWFMDNTNILNGIGNWKYIKDVPVQTDNYINIPPEIEERNIYKLDNKEQFATIKPKKFGGLTYKIYNIVDDGDKKYAEIETCDFGRVYVRITDMTPITEVPTYEHGNY
jgi:murein DD-endopeptidase MepM/ murein hydrolase activator NlpD